MMLSLFTKFSESQTPKDRRGTFRVSIDFKSHRRGGEDLTRFLTLTTFSNNQTNKFCPVKFLEEGSEADFTGALNKSKIEI
jgi:hypothetical protein